MTYTGMKARDKFVAGDEIEVDGKVYVVVLNANMILAKSDVCEGCAAFSAYETCQSLCEVDKTGRYKCRLEDHLIFKLKGDSTANVSELR